MFSVIMADRNESTFIARGASDLDSQKENIRRPNYYLVSGGLCVVWS